MFDIGWQELFLIAVVALIVIGPKDLPRVMRTVMRGVRKAREMARDLQGGIDELAREADLDDLKKELESTGDVAKQIEATVDPAGELDRTVQKQLSDAAEDLKESTAPDKSPTPSAPAAGDAGETPPQPDPARKATG
ncbi:MAG: twin-arginine translocase subunit TatB [Rhodospirillales bacterium]|nr:twin-arginine translocase subunit TatB [Rhodospirillales bacterium]